MRVIMDRVDGARVQKSTTSGLFVRAGLLILDKSELPSKFPDTRVLLTGLGNNVAVPQEGDKLDSTSYSDWICVDRQVVAKTALHYNIYVIYRWLGALTIRDHSTISSALSQINPKDKKPIYNTWTDPANAARKITKLANMRTFDTIRHLTYSKTLDYAAGIGVLNGLKCVNDAVWQDLPAGFWLVSDVDGQSLDGFKTYTYSATFSTMTEIDWSSYDVVEDEYGNPVYADPTKFAALVQKAYVYGTPDNSLTGVVKIGMFKAINFPSVFGIPAK